MATGRVTTLRKLPLSLQQPISLVSHKNASTLLFGRTSSNNVHGQIVRLIKTRVCTCACLRIQNNHGSLKSKEPSSSIPSAMAYASSSMSTFTGMPSQIIGSSKILYHDFAVRPTTHATNGARKLSSTIHSNKTLDGASSTRNQLTGPPLRSGNPSRSLFGFPERSAWASAITDAEKIVGYPTSFIGLRCLLSDELSNVAMQARKLIGTKHPLVKMAKNLVYDGKHNIQMRGLIILLISKAAGPSPQGTDKQNMVRGIYPSQRTLAEIAEMIHTAFLVHKGVVNIRDLLPSDGPRSVMEFGNKISVLSGDFLLANACMGLAKMRNTYVVDLVSQAISDLTEAAFMAFSEEGVELGESGLELGESGLGQLALSNQGVADWARYVYLSSGSLIAKSCRAALELAGHREEMQKCAFEFGKNIALAQQLHQELQLFTTFNGNPSFSLTSAPVLLHLEGKGNRDMLRNQTKVDMKKLHREIRSGSAIAKSQDLCRTYAESAHLAIGGFPQSEARDALLKMVKAVS